MAEPVKLLPCPFCGGSDFFVMRPTCTRHDRYDPRDRAYPVVLCRSCKAETAGDNWDATAASAIAAWNRRAGEAE